MVVDHRRKDDAEKPGEDPLHVVEKAVDLRVGGVAILAIAVQKMGLDAGIMGCVGNDIAGYGLKNYLAIEAQLNVDAVRIINAETSTSFIRLTPTERYIEHSPGASVGLSPGEPELAFIQEHNPKLTAIGYAGLLPKLDAGHGRGMARWIKAAQSAGSLVALDTHTVSPYTMLERSVPLADIFVCNKEEARGITNISSADASEIVSAMWSKFRAIDPRHFRLMGAAFADGAQLAYGYGQSYRNTWVANPHYGTFEPGDLTGAGDYFRAGLYAEVIEHIREFVKGSLDIAKAGLKGHSVAATNLRRCGSNSE